MTNNTAIYVLLCPRERNSADSEPSHMKQKHTYVDHVYQASLQLVKNWEGSLLYKFCDTDQATN